THSFSIRSSSVTAGLAAGGNGIGAGTPAPGALGGVVGNGIAPAGTAWVAGGTCRPEAASAAAGKVSAVSSGASLLCSGPAGKGAPPCSGCEGFILIVYNPLPPHDSHKPYELASRR